MKDHFSRALGLGFVLDGQFFTLSEAKEYLMKNYEVSREEAVEYIQNLFFKKRSLNKRPQVAPTLKVTNTTVSPTQSLLSRKETF